MLAAAVSGAVQRDKDVEGDAALPQQLPEHELGRFGGAVGIGPFRLPIRVGQEVRRPALGRWVVAEDVEALQDVVRQAGRRDAVGVGDALLVVVDEGKDGPDRATRGAEEAVSGEVGADGGESQAEVGRLPVDQGSAEPLLAVADQGVKVGLGGRAGAFPSGQPSRSQVMNS